MLGSTTLTAYLGSAPAPTADAAVLKSYAKSLQAAGLALFITAPRSKVPLDMRSTQARNKDAKAAAEEGRPEPRGIYLATTDSAVLGRWITAYRKSRPDEPLGLAMSVGPSRLVVVDVDTPAEMATFRQMWAAEAGDPNLVHVAPTVQSPGVQAEDGTWVHHGGGHFYFTLPDGFRVPEAPGSLTIGPAGATFTVYWSGRYVLIPPTVRAEGAYQLAGTDHVLPRFLQDRILTAGITFETRKREQIQRREERAANGGDTIERWDLDTPWETVLESADWTFSGRLDSCSCEIWTRPGDNPSPKSATAHSAGCADARYQSETPPIHVWSDNVDGGLADWIASHGTKTLSKLQFVAAVHHDGNIRKAMDALGLQAESDHESPEGTSLGADLDRDLGVDTSAMDDLMEPPRPTPTPTPAETVEITSPATPDEVTAMFASPTAEGYDESENPPGETGDNPSSEHFDAEGPWRPTLAPFDHWRNLPPPTYLVDGWVEDKALSMVMGPPGAGKSAVVLDMACSIAMGLPWQGQTVIRTRVLYIAGEGGSGAAQRVKAWEAEHGANVGQDLFMILEPVLVGAPDRELWPWLAEMVKANGIGLVVFDTLARMSLGLEENSSTDMGKAVARFDRLRRDADTGVMVVHHTARGQTHGRGSSAVQGAMESEVLVQPSEEDDDEDRRDGAPTRLTATVTKQKNAADGATKDLTLVPTQGSIVIGNASGSIGDPFADPKVVEFAAAPVETATELAIRIQDHLHRLPVQGATKTELTRDVPRLSRIHRKDRDAWKAAVAAAVDRGLATGLVATFGSDASQRYLAGSASPEDARRLDSAEADDERSGS